MKLGVVVKTPDMEVADSALRNLAAAVEVYTAAGIHLPMAMVTHRVPVFHVGELLVCEDDGREIPYPARKPAKWPGVEVEWYEVDQLEDAVLRVRRLTERW